MCEEPAEGAVVRDLAFAGASAVGIEAFIEVFWESVWTQRAVEGAEEKAPEVGGGEMHPGQPAARIGVF